MFDTLAILQTEVDQRLGHMDRSFLDPEDVTAAAIETLSFRGMQAAQSQYGRSSRHVDFIPTSRDAPVNKASEMAVPSYVQIRISTLPANQWEIVHTSHQSALSEHADRRVAWYKDENQKLHLALNYDPAGLTHRLWYYTDPVLAQALNDPLGLPTRHGFLFLHDTILRVISTVISRAAQLPEADQLTVAQLKALEVAASNSNARVMELEPLWRSENNAEKAPRGRNRRPVLGRMGMG